MADDTPQRMSTENSKRLKVHVSVLGFFYLMTFAGGFLQGTQFNFFNYIFFFFLFTGGVGLMRETARSEQDRPTRVFLFLTGTSTTLLLVLFICYEWFRLKRLHDLEASMEALLYLLTLFFWVGVIGSLVLTRRPKGLSSTQP